MNPTNNKLHGGHRYDSSGAHMSDNSACPNAVVISVDHTPNLQKVPKVTCTPCRLARSHTMRLLTLPNKVRFPGQMSFM